MRRSHPQVDQSIIVDALHDQIWNVQLALEYLDTLSAEVKQIQVKKNQQVRDREIYKLW